MKKGIAVITACFLIVMTFTGCGTIGSFKKRAEVKKKLDKEFTDLYGPGKFSGYVYISKDGKVLLDKGYGKADFEKGTLNTKQTRFDIGSLTKQITAVAIMQLQEKKLLNVNDKIDKYLPCFPHGSEITIHQLLNHTSGLPEYSTDFDIRKFRPSYKNFGVEGREENVNLLFKPGTDFQYSNPGYILLGYIIERVSGKTLDAYFYENIFKPLGMENTGFRNEKGQVDNLAAGYQNENKDKPEESWTLMNIGYVYASGGICSDMEDMIKWEKSLQEQKLISRESYDEIYTPDKNDYGYGWYIYKDAEGKRTCEHYGLAAGYRSYAFRGIDDDAVIIILSNFQNTPIDIMARMAKDYIEQM